MTFRLRPEKLKKHNPVFHNYIRLLVMAESIHNKYLSKKPRLKRAGYGTKGGQGTRKKKKNKVVYGHFAANARRV